MPTWVDGGDPVISGSDALTKPGGSQFTVSGGNGPYVWSISGTGVTINSSTGYVTMGDGACGSFFVTCTDCKGRVYNHAGTRVTNNGHFEHISSDWDCAVFGFGSETYSFLACPPYADTTCYFSTGMGSFVEDVTVISGGYKALLVVMSGSANFPYGCPQSPTCEEAVVNLYVAKVDENCSSIPAGAQPSYAYLISPHVYAVMVSQQVQVWVCN